MTTTTAPMPQATPTRARDRLRELAAELAEARQAEALARAGVDELRDLVARENTRDARGELNRQQRTLAKAQEATGSLEALLHHAERLAEEERKAEDAERFRVRGLVAKALDDERKALEAEVAGAFLDFRATLDDLDRRLAELASATEAHNAADVTAPSWTRAKVAQRLAEVSGYRNLAAQLDGLAAQLTRTGGN
jgi:hypothetical protein